jgi:hypothetical protein
MKSWSWWRVFLPFWVIVGQNVIYVLVGFLCLFAVRYGEDEGIRNCNSHSNERHGVGCAFTRRLLIENEVLAKETATVASIQSPLSLVKLVSGMKALEISDIQEVKTELRQPGDQIITDLTLHRGLKGVLADHRCVV